MTEPSSSIAWAAIEQAEVRVRRLAPADLDAFLAYRADEQVGRYQSWAPMDATAARVFIDDVATAPVLSIGQWCQLGIARRRDDRLVGDIGLCLNADASVEIGFTLARTAQGRGWAQQALRGLIGWLQLQSGVARIVAISDARNAASLRLLERLGFAQTGREAVVVKGEPCIDVHFECAIGKAFGPAGDHQG